MEKQHNHSIKQLNVQCPACLAIMNNEQPSEDGIYVQECNDPDFMILYWRTYDELVSQGVIDGSKSRFDNTELLKLTRETYRQ